MTGSELFDESMRRAEADENAALRARVAAAEDRCDEHVAHVVEIGDVLDAEDGETALEAAKRTMRKLEAATNLIAHTAARVADQQEELNRVLSDWNALKCAIGSPSNGGAVGHAKAIVARVAELEQQVAASSMCSEDAKAAQRMLMGETFPEAILRLEKQVAALADALEDELKLARGWAKNSIEIHAASDAALRAAGRKT